MAFTFTAAVAYDPASNKPVKNASFQVYATTDTAFLTPLAITDAFGAPLPSNILNSGSQGVFPQFQQATNATVVISDSTKTYAWTVVSVSNDATTASFINTTGSGSALAVKSEVTTGSTATALNATYAKADVVGSVIAANSFWPRLTGETDDALRIQRAVNAVVAGGYNSVHFSPGTFTLNSLVTVANDDISFLGSDGKTILSNGTNTTILDVNGCVGFQFRNIRVNVTDLSRTNYPVTCTNAARPIFDTVNFNGADGSYRSGIYFKGASGSMGTVSNAIFNHSCIRTDVWDVKIDRVYCWAMSCEFGIGIYAGAGNVTITNFDVVPPLQSNANGRAGIVIDGTNASFNVKMSNIYLDGNPTLDVKTGIYVGNGAAAILMENVNANRMDNDCIVLDSCYNVVLNGYSGYSNNNQGRGSREIYITKTGAQPVENIRLTNIQCLQTAAVTGTAAPAIEVNPLVAGEQVTIEGFNIKQPSGGSGYTLPEVKCDSTKTSLVGIGYLSKYSARGSQAIAATDTSATITLSSPYPMAYQPLASDVHLEYDVIMPSVPRIQFTSANQIFLAWTGTPSAAGNIYWRVDFRR